EGVCQLRASNRPPQIWTASLPGPTRARVCPDPPGRRNGRGAVAMGRSELPNATVRQGVIIPDTSAVRSRTHYEDPSIAIPITRSMVPGFRLPGRINAQDDGDADQDISRGYHAPLYASPRTAHKTNPDPALVPPDG